MESGREVDFVEEVEVAKTAPALSHQSTEEQAAKLEKSLGATLKDEKIEEALEESLQQFDQQHRVAFSDKIAAANRTLTVKEVQDCLEKLKGAIMIVYPMKLPGYDPVQAEIDNC